MAPPSPAGARLSLVRSGWLHDLIELIQPT
jgi:hypothetical protein